MKKFKFRVTATVSKVIEVVVDQTQWAEVDVEDEARNIAHEQFSIYDADESYREDSELITD